MSSTLSVVLLRFQIVVWMMDEVLSSPGKMLKHEIRHHVETQQCRHV